VADLQPLRWSRAYVDTAAQHGEVPEFATVEWHRLSGNDPRRIAAAIVAAERWRDTSTAAILGCHPADEVRRLVAQREASLTISGAHDWDEEARRIRWRPRTADELIRWYEQNAARVADEKRTALQGVA